MIKTYLNILFAMIYFMAAIGLFGLFVGALAHGLWLLALVCLLGLPVCFMGLGRCIDNDYR